MLTGTAARLWLLAGMLVIAACSREPAGTRSLEMPDEPAGVREQLRGTEGPRIALVVGNGRYADSALANPANDAQLIAATLRDLGFTVQLHQDADQVRMKRAIQAFGASLEQAGPDAVGLFFYAGHGVQLNGRNYLIPVAANIARDADVEIEAVSADWVLEQMRFARNRLNFVILDACRNNPFVRSLRSADRGLAKMDAPAGVLIAYSTAPGDVAADGSGRNSPYSEALARAMRGSGEPAELMFKQVRDDVRQATTQRQTPWESSSLTGRNFHFAQIAAPVAAPAAAQPAAAQPPAAAPAPSSGAPTETVAIPREAPTDPATQTVEPEEEPFFMSEPLCRGVVGTWRIDANDMRGTVEFDAGGRALAKVGRSSRIPAEWDCDAGKLKLVIRFENGARHEVVGDSAEKLFFGYDEKGGPLTYTR